MKLDSVKARNHDYKKFNTYSKTIAVNKEYVDLQFFPEGGKLVASLTSKMGFKALDYKNEGTKVSGTIVDQDGNIIMPFQSNNLGMGTTYITPQKGITYFATIKDAKGIVYKYALPEVDNKGVVLSIKEQKEHVILSLTTKEITDTTLFLNISSGGVEQDDFSMALKNGAVITGLEKAVFPEGLLKFRLSNKEGQILCERLFFNFKEEERIEINASLNLKQYNQRGKTVVKIQTKDKDSTGIKTNLSVLVVNKDQLGAVHENRNNILSYFLLNSELKGRIEKPASYFDENNKRRKYDMDALLLTQGWSNYKYEKTVTKNEFKFLPEKGLTVSGKVKNLIMTKKELSKPLDLTMIYGPLNVMTQEVDKTGDFYFQLEDYYKDTFKVVIQSKSKKGKKKDFTIELDDYKSPEVNYKKEIRIALADSTNTYVTQSILRNEKVKAFEKTNGVVDLDEVEIEGYKMTPEREKMLDLHGPPDVVIEEELLNKKENWHSSLFSLLESSYPEDIEIYTINTKNLPIVPYKDKIYLYAGVIEYKNFIDDPKKEELVTEVVVARDYNTDFTFIVIDGIPVSIQDYRYLYDLPIEGVKSVELIKRPKLYRKYEHKTFNASAVTDTMAVYFTELFHKKIYPGYFQLDGAARTSIISIYTHAGKGIHGLQRTKGMFKGNVPGFTPKREFYAPKYDVTSDNDWTMPDLRSVVYWAPNIETDAEGDAEVEFYNGDDVGDMLIITEGITETGKLGSSKAVYTVDKKIE